MYWGWKYNTDDIMLRMLYDINFTAFPPAIRKKSLEHL